MIQIILGDKGSGKTKRLIDCVNEALKTEHGEIIFIDDDKRYMYDLRHEIRFVDISEYPTVYKSSADQVLAFISGMLAINYDLSLISMDAFAKIVKTPLSDPSMETFFENLEKIGTQHNCNFLLSVSGMEDTIPSYIRKYVI